MTNPTNGIRSFDDLSGFSSIALDVPEGRRNDDSASKTANIASEFDGDIISSDSRGLSGRSVTPVQSSLIGVSGNDVVQSPEESVVVSVDLDPSVDKDKTIKPLLKQIQELEVQINALSVDWGELKSYSDSIRDEKKRQENSINFYIDKFVVAEEKRKGVEEHASQLQEKLSEAKAALAAQTKENEELRKKLKPVEPLANGIEYVAGLTANVWATVEKIASRKNVNAVLSAGIVGLVGFGLYKMYRS